MGRKNKEDGSKREFYVVDDIGGIKMDRLWGIVEKTVESTMEDRSLSNTSGCC